MRFLAPSLLGWCALLGVPILLYLFRRRPRSVRVSTLPFFKSLARHYQESAWLRRLKRLLSFALTAAVVLGGGFALARLAVAPPAAALKSVVLLVDRSASMAAHDAQGRTRLDAALAEAKRRLGALPGGVSVTVMTYDRRPEILLPRTLDRRAAARALDAVKVRPIAGAPDEALALAARLAALETPAAIWQVTDAPPASVSEASPDENDTDASTQPATRPAARTAGDPVPATAPATRESLPDFPETPGAAPGVGVERIYVGLPEPVNAGITGFELRRLPLEPGKFEAFVQVHGSGPKPLDAQLEVRLDDKPVAVHSVTLPPGGRQKLLVPVEAGEGRTLSLHLAAPGDALPLDDSVYALVPPLVPIRVLWVAPQPGPFTQLALTSLGDESGIQVFQADGSAWPPKEPVDVVIFDGWLPSAWPEGVSSLVINPPGSLGPVQVARLAGDGLPLDAVRVARERHPLLYGVASGRVAVTQTGVLEASGPLEPLWVGPSGPVLMAGEVRGQRIAVLAFAPERSERLGFLASYPLLIGNAIYWAARPTLEAHGVAQRRTGELVALEGESVTWSVPDRGGSVEVPAPIRGRWTELDRIGTYRTDRGKAGSAALLSAAETVLVPPPPTPTGGAIAAAPLSPRSWLSGDLGTPLTWLVLAVLVVESWLFHRQAVY